MSMWQSIQSMESVTVYTVHGVCDSSYSPWSLWQLDNSPWIESVTVHIKQSMWSLWQSMQSNEYVTVYTVHGVCDSLYSPWSLWQLHNSPWIESVTVYIKQSMESVTVYTVQWVCDSLHSPMSLWQSIQSTESVCQIYWLWCFISSHGMRRVMCTMSGIHLIETLHVHLYTLELKCSCSEHFTPMIGPK